MCPHPGKLRSRPDFFPTIALSRRRQASRANGEQPICPALSGTRPPVPHLRRADRPKRSPATGLPCRGTFSRFGAPHPTPSGGSAEPHFKISTPRLKRFMKIMKFLLNLFKFTLLFEKVR